MAASGWYICAHSAWSCVAAELPEKYTVQPFSNVITKPAAGPP